MKLSQQEEMWAVEALCAAGRTNRNEPVSFEALPANPERIDSATLTRFKVVAGSRTPALLIVGESLAELKLRSDLFQAAYPALACPVFARTRIGTQDLLLTEFFDGRSAEAALQDPSIGIERVLSALQKLAEQFDDALQPSSSESALAELQALFERVLQIPFWTASDRGFLTHVVFPFAQKQLIHPKPVKRVTNGDLTLGNILIAGDQSVRIVDYEQASETHFFSEDWLRITYWKAPQAVRDFALRHVPDEVATKIHLWLKQMVFEAAVIKPEKAQTDIRHWAEEIADLVARGCPELKTSLFHLPSLGATNSGVNISDAAPAPTHDKALGLFHYARLMANRVGQSETKVRQMQRTFSWRSTAWLRTLRRLFLDRFRPLSRPVPVPPPDFPFVIEDFTPARAARLHFHLDTAEDEISAGAQVCVTGWVFSALPPKLVQVRARAGTRTCLGEYGLERPEVAEKFLPQAYSRFRVNIALEPGDTRFDLEAKSADGEWLIFFSKALQHPTATAASWACSVDTVRSQYQHWVGLYDSPSDSELAVLSDQAKALAFRPLISLIMPVYNTEERWLVKAIEAVRKQTYTAWELCMADDKSTLPHVRRIIEQHAKADPRIKAVFRPVNGHISAASNSALALATGDFTALIDHDDELAPHALYCVAELLSRHRDAEIIYSDEDKIGIDGIRFDPHFKPDWNPDLLNGQNYLSHLTVYRTATLRTVGGFRVGCEGSQDWDLALRIAERVPADRIHHIPRVLYHWRAVDGSTATHLKSKGYANKAAQKALQDHFERTKQKVLIEQAKGGHWHVQYQLPEPAPLVTLVIPTRNRRDLLVRTVESILKRTRYPNFEILIADNDSDDAELFAYYDRMKGNDRFQVIRCPGPFNFSAINNRAVKHARGEIIGLLNNDLEVIQADWLHEMVGHALRPGIGVVGAKLYYPDLRLQHAGVITGLGGVAGHEFKGFPKNDPGTPQFRPHVVHNVSAVTAACVVMRKSVFEQAGGFDEENLKVAFNDVDFCLRVEALGYRNLFTPFAELIHHESASRGAEDSPEKVARFAKEIEYMKKRWGQRLLHDPAYNPNLTLDTEDFAYAFPPRHLPIPGITPR